MSWLSPKRTRPANASSKVLETTITYLRMDAPPAHYPQRPLNVTAALFVAPSPPLPFYRYLYFQVGVPHFWEARLRMSDAALKRAIHAPNCEITVLYVDGAPAGFFELNRKDRQTTDLAYFGTMPHVHGRGLGAWFLGQAIHAAWAQDPDFVTVNTCTLDHPAALPLYQKLGFRPYRRSEGRVRPLGQEELGALATREGLFADQATLTKSRGSANS